MKLRLPLTLLWCILPSLLAGEAGSPYIPEPTIPETPPEDSSTELVFQGGTYDIDGTVLPSAVMVKGADPVILNNGTDGCIGGDAALTKTGSGTLYINLDNAYTGGTCIYDGCVVAGAVSAFGTGNVTLEGGSLDMGGLAIANNLVVKGDATLTHADAFTGSLTLEGGVLSGDTIHLENGTVWTLESGTINNALTGYGRLVVRTDDVVTLGGGNTCHGVAVVESGTLVVKGYGSWSGYDVKEGGRLLLEGTTYGTVRLDGGSMETVRGYHMVFGQSLYMRNGYVKGDVETSIYSGLMVQGETTIDGDLYMSGGSWSPDADTPMTVTGRMVLIRRTLLHVEDFEESGSPYVLATYGSLEGDLGCIWFGKQQGNERCRYEVQDTGTSLLLYVSDGVKSLVWPGGKGVWQEVGGLSWKNGGSYTRDLRFHNNDSVTFDSSATVRIEGKVAPAALVVSPPKKKSVVFSGEGCIVGSTSLVMSGKGSLKLNESNLYTGGTSISDGKVTATTQGSFGSGAITLSGGTLDFGGQAVANDVTATGGAVSGAKAYAGRLQVNGALTLSRDVRAAGISLDGAILISGRIKDTHVDMAGGIVTSKLSGGTSLTVTGESFLYGTLEHTGVTRVDGGSLYLAYSLSKSALVVENGGRVQTGRAIKKDILLRSGTLVMGGGTGSLSLGAGQSLVMDSGTVCGNVVCRGKSAFSAERESSVSGSLIFKGGVWRLGEETSVEVGGKLVLQKSTLLDVTGCHAVNGSYTFVTCAGISGVKRLTLGNAASAGRKSFQLDTSSDGAVTLVISGENAALTWAGGSGRWDVGKSSPWSVGDGGSERFYYGDSVLFDTAARVTLCGRLAPLGVTVSAAEDVVFTGSGGLCGDTVLRMDGTGTLRLNSRNLHTGGTVITAGRVVATGADSFGSGVISLQGGVLDLGKRAVANPVSATGGSLANAASYKGVLTIDGEVVLDGKAHAGSLVVEDGVLSGGRINKTAVILKGGALDSEVAGSSTVTTQGDGVMCLRGANTYTGATTLTGGTLKLDHVSALGRSKVFLQGGTLDMNGLAVRNTIFVDKGGCGGIRSGSAFAGTVRVKKGGVFSMTDSLGGTLRMEGGTLDLSSVPQDSDVTLARLVTSSLSDVYVGGYTTGGCYKLLTIGNTAGFDMSKLRLVGMEVPENVTAFLELSGNDLMMMFLHFVYVDPVPYAMENESDGAEVEALVTANPAETSTAPVAPLAAYALSNPRVDGIIYTTQASAQIDGNRAAMDTVRDLMGGARMVVGDRGYRFALQATSANSRVMNDAKGMPGYNRNSIGGLLMVEKGLNDHMVAGLTLGHEHTDVRVRGLNTWRSNDTRLGAHLLAGGQSWRSSSYVGFGLHDYDMKRESATGTYTSKPTGCSLNMMEELAAVVAVGETSVIEPFLRVESSLNGINGTHERGGDASGALGIAHQNAWATTFTLGARYTQELRFGGAMRPARLALEAGVSKSVGDEGAQVDVYSWNDRSDRSTLSPAKRDRWGAKLGGSLILPISDAETINLGASVHLRGTGTEVNANVGYSLAF